MAIKLEQSNRTLPTTGTNVPEAQEWVRGRLAIGVLILFGLIILISVLYALFGDLTLSKSDFIKFVISSLVGILGFVFGFYYGQNNK